MTTTAGTPNKKTRRPRPGATGGRTQAADVALGLAVWPQTLGVPVWWIDRVDGGDCRHLLTLGLRIGPPLMLLDGRRIGWTADGDSVAIRRFHQNRAFFLCRRRLLLGVKVVRSRSD